MRRLNTLWGRCPIKPSLQSSARRVVPDYPLEGTALDVSIVEVLHLPETERRNYVRRLLAALQRVIKKDEMTLKPRTPFKTEMRDVRKLLHTPPDAYLFVDDKKFKRNVLGKGAPGASHVFWSRHQMWKMATKGGDLRKMILDESPTLTKSLERLFDPENNGKRSFRNPRRTAVQVALSYLQFDKGSGTAFPPFHAKFLADRFLPLEGDCIVFDPCAGWGGRMLGTLCVNRTGKVTYFGTDPERRNKFAYDGLGRRINIYLKKEIYGEREFQIFYAPFENWLKTKKANLLREKVDLVITSPPYFSAENYNPDNKRQSANKFKTYEAWRDGFYRALFQGAQSLLKPGGVFVLNIADVAEAPALERDARKLAAETGFVRADFFKLAMSVNPGNRKQNAVRHAVFVNDKMFKYEPVFCFRKPAALEA